METSCAGALGDLGGAELGEYVGDLARETSPPACSRARWTSLRTGPEEELHRGARRRSCMKAVGRWSYAVGEMELHGGLQVAWLKGPNITRGG